MAVIDSRIPPILAQKHDTEPSAFTPENLVRQACGRKRMTTSGMIAIAAGRLRSRLSP
jgi:uridine phosphorylase